MLDEELNLPENNGAFDAVFYDHKGFNWMMLRELLAGGFHLERTLTSPLP